MRTPGDEKTVTHHARRSEMSKETNDAWVGPEEVVVVGRGFGKKSAASCHVPFKELSTPEKTEEGLGRNFPKNRACKAANRKEKTLIHRRRNQGNRGEPFLQVRGAKRSKPPAFLR